MYQKEYINHFYHDLWRNIEILDIYVLINRINTHDVSMLLHNIY